MKDIAGADRSQILLIPDCIDNYIDENNVARVIEAFVNRLDFIELGFAHAELNPCGRPPYDPAMLLKLYLYGYLNHIRSSRRLEAPAQTKKCIVNSA